MIGAHRSPASPLDDTHPPTLTHGTAEKPRIPSAVLLLACCMLLMGLAFATRPGDIIADTKLDMAINPVGFLARALNLWDSQQFGQLQNQAVGYFFPMGPFFILGKLAMVPPWVIQRLWIGAVLIAAFLGTVRLAGRLRIGTPWTQAAAGLAFALSPTALATLGEYSGEFLPEAMLPWILLPLVGADLTASGGRRARAAARSATAVALCGGINASATAAVLVPAVICILTRPGRRLRILAWWVPAIVLAIVWWSVPLVLLGKYGVSFLPYTEAASATTSVTSLSNTLRGTENWVTYLVVNGQPWWPLGFRIATQELPTLLTGLLAALGLAGLIRRGPSGQYVPERRFLIWSVLAGVVIISTGYVSSLGNPLAGPLADLINGPASAFRNLWKFDPMIRLPLALGLAHLVAVVRVPRLRLAAIAAAGVGIVGLALPAYITGLAMEGSFSQIPPYWVSAANWLNAHAGHQAVLIAPGAPFGQYLWGSPLDEVLQPLTNVDWAERDLSYIGSPGNARLLDAIDQRMAAGDGSAALTQVIARMGIKYVVIRNDLNRSVLEGSWPAQVNRAMDTSPGMRLVAQFGPLVGSFAPDDAVTNFDSPYPAVEIFQVAGASPVATVQPAASTLRVYGGPESLLTLADEGLLADRPVLINNDGAGLPVAGSVLTDSLRRQAQNFGELRTSYSPTLTATQPPDTFEATDDYTEPGWNSYQAVAQYIGIKNVTASSSASDVGALPNEWASGRLPYAAVDGNPQTMWESGSWTGPMGQWIQVGFDSRVDLGTVYVAFADSGQVPGPPVTQVRVTTAAGSMTDPVAVTSVSQPLRVPPGDSAWLRITVTGLSWQPNPPIGAQVGIYEISVPGVQASRTIVAPAVPGPDPSAVVLAKQVPQPSGCMLTSLRWVCSPSLVTPTEEQYGFDHSFNEPYSEPVRVRGSAILIASSLVDHYVRLSPRQALVTASSTYTPDPEDQPLSAFDGNPETSWIASPSDAHPKLSIQWGYKRTIGQVTIQRPPGAAGLLEVLIEGSKGQLRGAIVGSAGMVKFAPMRTTGLTFTFTPLQAPLQISDVVIPGVPFVGTPSGTFRLPCGFGPQIELNGSQVPTRVSGSFTSLLTGGPLQFTACSTVMLAAGTNRVVEPATDGFSIQDMVLTSVGGPALAPAAPAAPATIDTWTPSLRRLRVSAAAASYLVVNENFNAGWRAVIDGRTLQPVRLDGWKQAWLLPAGTDGVVTVTYQPGTWYRDALFGGLGALVLIMLMAVWPATWPAPAGPSAEGSLAGGPLAVAPLAATSSAGASPGSARRRRWTLRRLGRAWPSALVVCGLVVTGFWLGGYPGAVIVPTATCLFLAATSYRGSPDGSLGSRRLGVEFLQPWVLGGLMLVAAACSAVGERLVLEGTSGLLGTALQNAIPQVVCLIVVGRLAAFLIIP